MSVSIGTGVDLDNLVSTNSTGGLLSAGGALPISFVLSQSAVPVILVPNGTVATNGTITLGTALPTIYAGGAWIRLPANAIVGGSAGLYWCVFSSTTVGVVKTDYVDPANGFVPYVATGAVTATGSNVAYTQTTGSDITLCNVLLQGNTLGNTSSLRISRSIFANNNSGGNKIFSIKWDTNILILNKTRTTTVLEAWGPFTVSNRGVLNRQVSVGPSYITDGATSGASASAYTSVDTSTDKNIMCTGNIAVATDYIVLEGFVFEILP